MRIDPLYTGFRANSDFDATLVLDVAFFDSIPFDLECFSYHLASKNHENV